MTSTSEQVISTLLQTDTSLQARYIEDSTLIDIGTIEEINKDGATISTGRFSGRSIVKYYNAEVVYPGTTSGTFSCDVVGATCLVFIPRTTMKNTQTQLYNPLNPSYNKSGVKALPVSSAKNDTGVVVRFNGGGEFLIEGDDWSIVCDETGIQLSQGTELILSKQGDGSLYLGLSDNETRSSVVEELSPKGKTETLVSSDGQVTLSIAYADDGSYSISQKDNNEEELSSISISPQGAISIISSNSLNITSSEDLAISTEGTLALSGESVTIDSTGSGSKVQINGSNLEVS